MTITRVLQGRVRAPDGSGSACSKGVPQGTPFDFSVRWILVLVPGACNETCQRTRAASSTRHCNRDGRSATSGVSSRVSRRGVSISSDGGDHGRSTGGLPATTPWMLHYRSRSQRETPCASFRSIADTSSLRVRHARSSM